MICIVSFLLFVQLFSTQNCIHPQRSEAKPNDWGGYNFALAGGSFKDTTYVNHTSEVQVL